MRCGLVTRGFLRRMLSPRFARTGIQLDRRAAFGPCANERGERRPAEWLKRPAFPVSETEVE
jgi:hypothetical protein